MIQRQHASVPTLGMIELTSIAKGLRVADLMLKRAAIEVLLSAPLGCGKYVIVVTGDEASLLEAVQIGRESAGLFLESSFYLPNIHNSVVQQLRREDAAEPPFESLGIVESSSIAAAIRCSDIAAKKSDARLIELTFDLDLGGKGYFTITGTLGDVEASVEAAAEVLREEGKLFNSEVIAAPHSELESLVIGRNQ